MRLIIIGLLLFLNSYIELEADDETFIQNNINDNILEEKIIIDNIIEKNILHNNWDITDIRQEYLNYAYKIGGKDFVLTLIAENDTMEIDRKGGIEGANGHWDYGICQINTGYHPDILSDGSNDKMFQDWFYEPYKQIDYCYKLFIGGTKFYGYNVRHTVEYRINFNYKEGKK